MTIHDLSVLHFPDQFPVWYRNYSQVVLPHVVRRSSHIITDAEFTKNDIHEFLNVPLDAISVIPLGVDRARFNPRDPSTGNNELTQAYPTNEPYFLHVGTLSPRKNLIRVLKALSIVRKSLRVPHQLLIIGDAGWGMNRLNEAVSSLGLLDAVHFIGSIPDRDLPMLYSSATAMVYASLYEGFGLPLLEAMACGCPVITSNVSSMPEVVDDAGLQCDPTDPESIAGKMSSIIQDSKLAARLRHRGIDRSRRFGWDRTAKRTLETYHYVAGRN